MQTLTGQCHCGNVVVALSLPAHTDHLSLYACRCSYCQLTAARWLGKPSTRLALGCEVTAEAGLYRMAHRELDYLVCRSCAIAVAGMVREPDGRYIAMVNARLLQMPAGIAQDEAVIDSPQMDEKQRAEARKKLWIDDVILDPLLAEHLLNLTGAGPSS